MTQDTLPTNRSLFLSVFVRYISMLLLMGLLFFGTARSFAYRNAWWYLGSMAILVGIGFSVLYRTDKALLAKRIRTNEKEAQQRLFVLLSGILITAVYLLPGLDYRFGWTHVPLWLVGCAWLGLIISYWLQFSVMLQNRYASRVVEIQAGQTLIDTGLYAWVRHPMYLSAVFLYPASALVLGSFVALIPAVLLPFTFLIRIYNEEKVLLAGLAGYPDYTRRVKYRLIPFIW